MDDDLSPVRWHVTPRGHRYLAAKDAPDHRPTFAAIEHRAAMRAEAHVEYNSEPLPDYEGENQDV